MDEYSHRIMDKKTINFHRNYAKWNNAGVKSEEMFP